MNTNSKNKARSITALLVAIFMLAPLCSTTAQSQNNEFGIWATFEASKKINKKFKFVGDAEFRTYDFVNNVERAAIGAKVEYKILKWLKANVGYSFMYTHKPDEISLKEFVIIEDFDDNGEEIKHTIGQNKNLDHDYWVIRNRVYATISGEYKVGRFEIGLRERLQYTHTCAATTNETKSVWKSATNDYTNPDSYQLFEETAPEHKKAKHNLTLRSRLSVKYDIPKCKINPFASIELYTRFDEWKGCDKLRYRIGASYKINKDNSLSLYYLYQDANDDDEPKGHAIGFEYSIDL